MNNNFSSVKDNFITKIENIKKEIKKCKNINCIPCKLKSDFPGKSIAINIKNFKQFCLFMNLRQTKINSKYYSAILLYFTENIHPIVSVRGTDIFVMV